MGRDPKEQEGKKTKGREGEGGKQNKQREVMESDWARKPKENREERRGGRRKKGEEEEEEGRFLPKLKAPRCWAPENPQTRPLLPPSPLTAPSPSAQPGPARLRWFPCGRFIFKNADAVPPPGPHTVATGASAKPRDPTQLWGGRER